MPRKTYTEQFKRDAVSLYESTPGATLNAIASDLGVHQALALVVRLSLAERLRSRRISYTYYRILIKSPCPLSGVRAHGRFALNATSIVLVDPTT
ncbi:transposase [Corynebacterium accolens]|nr:transposase [Corynebacterium accolens]WKS60302.1 transposase [Corynebacterium accolens]